MNSVSIGLTDQEREIYLAHQKKRAEEELERLEYQKQLMREYRLHLIEDVLKYRTGFTREQLEQKSIRALEYLA